MDGCGMPVFEAKVHVTAVHSTLRQEDKRPIRCNEGVFLLPCGGVKGTDGLSFETLWPLYCTPSCSTGVLQRLLPWSNGDFPLSLPLLWPCCPRACWQQREILSLEFGSQVCPRFQQLHFMGFNAREADYAGGKLPSE